MGVLLTAFTYNSATSAGGGTYAIFWGAIAFGGYRAIKSWSRYRELRITGPTASPVVASLHQESPAAPASLLVHCPSCDAARVTGDGYCGKCGYSFARARKQSDSVLEGPVRRWQGWPWPKWIAVALVLAYVLGLHPVFDLAYPKEGDCGVGYSLHPVDDVCRRDGTSKTDWYLKGRFDRGQFRFRTALYLDTPDIQLFNFDFAQKSFTGLVLP